MGADGLGEGGRGFRPALEQIRERTMAGLDAAAEGGRKAVVTAEKLERARAIIAKGLTVREAAIRLKVGKTALYEALRAASA